MAGINTLRGLAGGPAGDSARRFGAALPVVGGLSKAIFGDPDEEAHTAQLKAMAQQYQAMRPQMAQARMTGLGNQLSLFGPIQQLMTKMYGPDMNFDLSKLLQNPLSGAAPETAPGEQNRGPGSAWETALAKNAQTTAWAKQHPGAKRGSEPVQWRLTPEEVNAVHYQDDNRNR